MPVYVHLLSIRNPALEGGAWLAPRLGRFNTGQDAIPDVQAVGYIWDWDSISSPQSLYGVIYSGRYRFLCLVSNNFLLCDGLMVYKLCYGTPES